MRNSWRTFSDVSVKTKADKPVFPEIEFMRLSTSWQESSKDASFCGSAAFGGRMYKRYHSKVHKETYMDFSYRGGVVSEQAAQAFSQLLSEPHAVSGPQLVKLSEVLGQTVSARNIYGEFVNDINSADVGAINGRNVLVIHWRHVKHNRRVISIYIDAFHNGMTVREIHFSTPADNYDFTHKSFYETVRSAQWACAVPPPVSYVA
jgi:hypothetical protein